jgi:hypothetical protein
VDDFWSHVWLAFFDSLFTAALIAIGAAIVVAWYQHRAEDQRNEREAQRSQAAKDRERITECLAQVCGLTEGPGTVEETFWAVRRFLDQ